MRKSLVYEFWIESTLKGFRKAVENKSVEDLISVVVDRAGQDTMRGGRFNAVYSKYHKEYEALLKELIYKNRENLNSRTLIEKMFKKVQEGVTVGLIQKLVNMSLKYLFSIDVWGYAKDVGITVRFEACDCPLDSIILDELKKNGVSSNPWTKLCTLNEYDAIQEKVRAYVSDSNLEYDFQHWKL